MKDKIGQKRGKVEEKINFKSNRKTELNLFIYTYFTGEV